jgi:hypothetical protein
MKKTSSKKPPIEKYVNSVGSRKRFWTVTGYATLGAILGEAFLMLIQYIISMFVYGFGQTPQPIFTSEIRYGIIALFTSAGGIYGAGRALPGSTEYTNPVHMDHDPTTSIKTQNPEDR